MAGRVRRPQEKDRLTECFKQEEFRSMFSDYVKELQDPKKSLLGPPVAATRGGGKNQKGGPDVIIVEEVVVVKEAGCCDGIFG